MQAKIVSRESTKTLTVLGAEYVIYVNGTDSSNALAYAELRMPVGAGIPRHVHTREDEVFHVLEGQITFTLGQRETTVGPQTTVLGPRGIAHGCRNAGAAVARMLVTIAPSGLEPMFEELSRLPPGAPDFSRVGEIVGRFGISFV